MFEKKWKNRANEIFFLFGDILGHRNEFKINTNFDDYSLLEDINNISEFEGRFLIVKVSQENNISVWTDIFGRMNVYWCKDEKSNFYITSSMGMIPSGIDLGNIDQNALAQLLTIYGRAIKKTYIKGKCK